MNHFFNATSESNPPTIKNMNANRRFAVFLRGEDARRSGFMKEARTYPEEEEEEEEEEEDEEEEEEGFICDSKHASVCKGGGDKFNRRSREARPTRCRVGHLRGRQSAASS